jgi:predicted dehydrogenase
VPPVAEPFPGVEWGRAVFELADSLRAGAIQHCTGQQALHVLETCLGILQSAAEGRRVDIESRFVPPAPLEWPRG